MEMTFPIGRLRRYDWKKEDGKYTTKEIGAAIFHVSCLARISGKYPNQRCIIFNCI